MGDVQGTSHRRYPPTSPSTKPWNDPGLHTRHVQNEALIILEDKSLAMAGKDLKQLGLPSPQRNLGDRLSREMLRATSYDVNELNQYVLANEPLLVLDQRAAHNAILDRIERKAGGLLFLDAPGGTGKTFVINLLLAKIRQQSKIAIAVASSGIAATLLQGGRTAHSTLKLPLNLTRCEAPLCCHTIALLDLDGDETFPSLTLVHWPCHSTLSSDHQDADLV